MVWRPERECSSKRSESIRATMAVDDMATASPTASPARQPCWKKCAVRMVVVAAVVSICAEPRPNTSERMAFSLFSSNSRPMENIRNTTPNSAR